MPSYIGKFIGFFTILYTLLIPSTIMNAFAESNVTREQTDVSKIDNVGISVKEVSKKLLTSNTNKKDDIQNADNISEHELPDFITRNIQTVGNILSSSSSQLAEQAKSYALGRINSTVTSEVQKWLSQFGTAKINFGLDKKGKLENNSLDLLLPLYDNKADWLLFSQLGYRNKDSRNTINLGLGGRFFYQNWMYGLNTFYDYDLTGKNRRLGLGGEIWGDYIKLSANAYRRLSDWQISRYFEEHQERPANGYDINGEFFLPAYPNLGGKLSYEQYFGDNVTLFNRKTKQKNPKLVKLGVTYTPIPLITMGVDYKQGESGRTETQFLANLNYRLGVPLSTQLSPDNVASMRTLAGSRYDLVERNNNIVLDHRKIPIAEFFVPIQGYKIKDNILIVIPKGNTKDGSLTADGTSKYIYKAIILDSNDKVVKNRIIPNVKWSKDKVVEGLTLNVPKGDIQTNSEGELTAELTMTGGKGEKDIVVSLSIEGNTPIQAHPVSFDKANVFLKPLPEGTMKINKSYKLTVVAKDDDDQPEINKKVTFTSVPEGIEFKPTSTKIDDNGEATTEFTSTNARQYKIIVTVDDLLTLKHPVEFAAPVEFEIASVEVVGTIDENGVFHQGYDSSKPLVADGKSAYKYRAKIVNKHDQTSVIPNQTFFDVKWSRDHEQIKVDLGQPEKDPKNENTTDAEGYLYATLKSHNAGVKDIKVTLQMSEPDDQKESKFADDLVSFKPKDQDAVLFVYNKFNQQKQRYFTETGHPYTVFNSLIGRLGKDSSGAFGNEANYSIELDDNNVFSNIVMVDKNSNVIIFPGPAGNATIKAEITEKDGRTYLYHYTVNMVRQIVYPYFTGKNPELRGYHRATDGVTCNDLNRDGNMGFDSFISVSEQDFMKSSEKHAINTEFDNLYDWGLFNDNPSDVDVDKLKYKLLAAYNSKVYVIFDPHTEKSSTESDDEGLLICTIDTKKDRGSK
ncbi:inverse autotransporter beta domain-containing protein [Xenorhabdus siamensis]|uniref:inverse autotransporter beta domain-containing protein n=1 Tax=Xenorhabdus siamensis TaxID=3136254 RepID=UPI0030F3CFAA